MADIEKVKTGIFEMLQRDTWKDIDKERDRFQPVLNNALALLKEHEPRVLTRLDLEQWERAVWFEDREEDVCYIALIANTDQYGVTLERVEPGYYHQMDNLNSFYGRHWRCWSEKPTEEQRKAEPWEVGEQE